MDVLGEQRSRDMAHVYSATRAIAPYVQSGNLVVLESTSPVGSTEEVREILREMRPELFQSEDQLHFAYCPERVLPGNIIHEL